MKKINLISIGLFLVLVSFIQSCECEEPDCDNRPSFLFKIVDNTSGKDFIYDLNNPLDEVKVYAGSKQFDIMLSKDFNNSATNKFLVIFLDPMESIHSFVIAKDTIPISFEFTATENKCCAEPFYEKGKITRSNLELEKDPEGIHIIRI